MPPSRPRKRGSPSMSCSNCGCDLSSQYTKQPCPWCGELQRTFHLQDNARVSVSRTAAYYDQHRGLLAALFGVAVVAAEGGYLIFGPLSTVVALVLSTAAIFVVPIWRE
jgi:hypothetical protein